MLLDGFSIETSRFLVKQPDGPWCVADMHQALEFPIEPRRYALGELVLTSSK
jgi:hypothetical protein